MIASGKKFLFYSLSTSSNKKGYVTSNYLSTDDGDPKEKSKAEMSKEKISENIFSLNEKFYSDRLELSQDELDKFFIFLQKVSKTKKEPSKINDLFFLDGEVRLCHIYNEAKAKNSVEVSFLNGSNYVIENVNNLFISRLKQEFFLLEGNYQEILESF